MDIAAVVVSVRVGADNGLVSGKLLPAKFLAQRLRPVYGQTVVHRVPWVKADNVEIEKQNAALMEENWSKGTKHAMKPLREMPGLFYKEMCEAGALGFIQSAPVPLRALYDRALLNDPHTTFDNLPEVCDIKLDEHQYKIIKQMVKERRNFWLEFDIRSMGIIQ
jgi:hypothetical protein